MISLLTAFFLWNAEASWSWWVFWAILSSYGLFMEYVRLLNAGGK